ncbi:MAG: NAD(P)-binding protein, partial [Clostridiales bacterium]|nr:NAD(P)-binding protein [Clostridiales bacterium]
MIRIANLRAPLGFAQGDLARIAAASLRVDVGQVLSARIAKKSVDARDKGDVHFVLSLDAQLRDEGAALARLPRGVDARSIEPPRPYSPPRATAERRPLVVGMGPAGLFAAYALALAGLRPIVIDRGDEVGARVRSVGAFWAGGPLDPDSNVQFGEGGAGAFSDGKLTTGIADRRCGQVLRILVECGAPDEILYLAKPHIGTDRLPGAVRALRERIGDLGGTAMHRTRLEQVHLDGGRVRGATLRLPDGGAAELDIDCALLAVGHSARDTFEMLHRLGVPMERKPFSVGLRVEHRQPLVDRAQYGPSAGHPTLGAAEYKLSCRLPGGRSAYTFCMCPGGRVVAAASEPGGVVTNGMSTFARDGENANSALLVGVEPSDFGGGDALAGVRFQRQWERAAFALGGGDFRAPAQRVGDFLRRASKSGEGDVEPTYLPGVRYAPLDDCLPRFVADSLRAATPEFD